ncbi:MULTISPECIES: hypothetical protein [Psychrilyobacter]|uniref:DUF2262 domain-containing protein n=1 Tax=Psychrilyobacter piezotolerans TaxID=2293438 RepID=A0ABX9KFK1_9FUSO|nr:MULTISPECIES: hypothetical protein [Psychrilyobacter]MCS5421609.1 hypothetical protein [Psychrilyobacter sp. S5]NDI78181.1 hypothetical protein [Psychrilyobacter piezotolerans]RDE60127.1 hypothetical protein DV867_11330 [Psychrilyobacter sp. S5]REI40309.1 hypothetical protein DYH56_11330 [Psychrilyobacter piezotolerans]
MEIKLKKIKIDIKKDDLIKFNEIEFARLVEGSFHEWTRLDEKKNKINWSGEFIIESEDGDFEYKIDTEKKYITSLDLDGFLDGEKIDIDEDMELLLSSNHSYIYELLIFHEVSKLNVVSDIKLKAVELSLFPKWARGYLADDLENNPIIQEFMEIFEPLMNEFEIVKKINLNLDSIQVEYEDEKIKEIFKDAIKKYLEKEIFFIMHDSEYRNLLPKLEVNRVIAAGHKFNPDLEEIEIYS